MWILPKELVEAAREYRRVFNLSNVALSAELQAELCQVILRSQQINGFDDPNETLVKMMKSLDFVFRNDHPEARGEVRLKNLSLLFKKIDKGTNLFIASTNASDLLAFAPGCVFVRKKVDVQFEPTLHRCKSGEEINVGIVKNAIMRFPETSKTPVLIQETLDRSEQSAQSEKSVVLVGA